MADMPFLSASFEWGKDMEILLYSDGIIEARNPKKEEYGYDRLERVIKNNFGNSNLKEIILSDIDKFVSGAPQHDDMTFVSVCSGFSL